MNCIRSSKICKKYICFYLCIRLVRFFSDYKGFSESLSVYDTKIQDQTVGYSGSQI
ncbi:unnamed protein product [Moneuplotes crassus]|uniref:Uncharacterized protein n=1 Tax=Euplotes crassus TaxID=5936 RepID=A0AAD1Y8C3_EUPCR|nr:unnamed protein product [Moneuplotes crassus]